MFKLLKGYHLFQGKRGTYVKVGSDISGRKGKTVFYSPLKFSKR